MFIKICLADLTHFHPVPCKFLVLIKQQYILILNVILRVYIGKHLLEPVDKVRMYDPSSYPSIWESIFLSGSSINQIPVRMEVDGVFLLIIFKHLRLIIIAQKLQFPHIREQTMISLQCVDTVLLSGQFSNTAHRNFTKIRMIPCIFHRDYFISLHHPIHSRLNILIIPIVDPPIPMVKDLPA